MAVALRRRPSETPGITDDARVVLDRLRRARRVVLQGLAGGAAVRCRPAAAGARRAGRGGSGRLGRILPACAMLVAAAQGRPLPLDRRTNLAGRWSVRAAATTIARRRARRRSSSRRGALLRRYGVVFRRLLTRETERGAVARADARLSPARSARRDSRRPVRVGHGRRAVRAARRGAGAARGAAHAGDRRDLHDLAPPIRSTWPASSPPVRACVPPAATGWPTATACRWRRRRPGSAAAGAARCGGDVSGHAAAAAQAHATSGLKPGCSLIGSGPDSPRGECAPLAGGAGDRERHRAFACAQGFLHRARGGVRRGVDRRRSGSARAASWRGEAR